MAGRVERSHDPGAASDGTMVDRLAQLTRLLKHGARVVTLDPLPAACVVATKSKGDEIVRGGWLTLGTFPAPEHSVSWKRRGARDERATGGGEATRERRRR